jgi:DNA-directed RNA polymerase II subunit RPB1
MLGQLAPLGTGELEVFLDQKMLDTVISDNARLGIMPNIGIKGSIMADGAATPYDSGSPMQETGYLDHQTMGLLLAHRQFWCGNSWWIHRIPTLKLGGGLSPYSARSPEVDTAPAVLSTLAQPLLVSHPRHQVTPSSRHEYN